MITFLKEYRNALIFAFGFLVDVFSLDRIDDRFSMLQHVVLLVLCLLLIGKKLLKLPQIEKQKEFFFFKYEDEAFHFMLGSLLSALAIFYFKSASQIGSYLFLASMMFLLVFNETAKAREASFFFKVVIFSFCLYSFFTYAIPSVIGFGGFWVFFGSLGFGSLVLYIFKRMLPISISQLKDVRKLDISIRYLLPGGLLALFILGWIPPVPLSLQYIGVYHKIERTGDVYKLLYDRPAWKFWEKGAQTFSARDGDSVHVFFRVFAPRNFQEKIQVRWMKKNAKGDWETTDRIPVKITGGRAEGYRGYANKQYWSEGKWRVSVERDDGRVIGSLDFDIFKDNRGSKRVFEIDRY